MISKLKHVFNVANSLVREHIVKTSLRSYQWPEVRKIHLKNNPSCAACGGSVRVQVHHKIPFHTHPELELDPTNLITLCMGERECHLWCGHLEDWHKFNLEVEPDSQEILENPDEFKELKETILSRSKR